MLVFLSIVYKSHHIAYTGIRGDIMLRWIVKKTLFCIVIIGLIYYFTNKNPQWMQNMGRNIGETIGNRLSSSVSRIIDRAQEDLGLSDVVEVFRGETEN